MLKFGAGKNQPDHSFASWKPTRGTAPNTEGKHSTADILRKIKLICEEATSHQTSEAITTLLGSAFGAYAAAFWRVSTDQTELIHESTWKLTPDSPFPCPSNYSLKSDRGFTCQAMRHDRPWPCHLASFSHQDPAIGYFELELLQLGLDWCIGLPIKTISNDVGIIIIHLTEISPAAYSLLEDIDLISDQLNLVAANLEKKKKISVLERDLDAILELSPDGFITFNIKDRCSYVNGAFINMTGIPKSDLAGISLKSFDILIKNRLLTSEQSYDSIFKLLPVGTDELTLSFPRPMIVSRTVRRLNETDPSSRIIIYFRDITHQTEIEKMKSQFLSTAAHELRTPISSIQGFTELLLYRTYPAETQKEMLETVYQQSTILSEMIHEMLDLARIEARGGRDFHMTRQQLSSNLELILCDPMLTPRIKDIEYQNSIPAAFVKIDPVRFLQVLQRIFSNVLKFSKAGTPIKFGVLASTSGDKALVTIQDFGIGMRPDQSARVFERFYRGDTSGSTPGTGLGLPLALEIMKQMHGNITVTSEHQVGTTVTLELPCEI